MQKLLLLHGALGGAAHFHTITKQLAVVFEIHTLDFDSHGGREVSESISISLFANEVLQYLDRNQIDKIAIFGYSMGGYVGLYLARHHAVRVEKLFTLATKLNWTPESAAKESKMLNPEVILEKIPKYAAALEQLHGSQWKSLMLKTAAMMVELGNEPTLKDDDFTQIQTPVLMAVGDKDAMVSIDETLHVYRLLPNAQLLVLPNTIHPIDRVDQVELVHQIRNYFL